MPTLSFANESGSTGKTTCVVNLATLLADQGRRVRVVDVDPQSNATEYLGVQDPPHHIGDLLLRRPNPSGTGKHDALTVSDVELPTSVDNLTLVPATRRLKLDVLELNRVRMAELRLANTLRTADPVEVTLIDCPGNMSVLTIAAIVAADSVVTVTQPTIKEASGISDLLDTIDDVRQEANPNAQLAAIIPSIVPAPSEGRVYQDTYSALIADGSEFRDLVTPRIRRATLVPESYSHGVPLPRYAPRDNVTNDLRAVLTWLETREVLAAQRVPA